LEGADIFISYYALLEVEFPAERINPIVKPFVTYVGTINDIQDRNYLLLITDSMEVEIILDYLGYPLPGDDDPLEFSSLFVLVGDGDYKEVFAFEGCVLYLYKDLWKITLQ